MRDGRVLFAPSPAARILRFSARPAATLPPLSRYISTWGPIVSPAVLAFSRYHPRATVHPFKRK